MIRLPTCMLAASLAMLAVPSARAEPHKGLVLPPTVLRVGAFGAPCTHSTLGAALADAPATGSTVIRLADNQIHNAVNVNIPAGDITIEGGYADCAQGTSTGNRTRLIGAAAADDSVIEILASDSERRIVLRHLEISGGTEDADGGGGLQVTGEAHVTLVNVHFDGNRSSFGGAVRLQGTAGNPVTLDIPAGDGQGEVALLSNDASQGGGGLHCSSATIVIDGSLVVSRNDAEFGGGGLLLSDCLLTLGTLGADVARLVMLANRAQSGGGLDANDSSLVVLRGRHSEFRSNQANIRGGAVHLVQGSFMVVRSAIFDDNRVMADGFIGDRMGGAIHIGGGSVLTIDQVGEACPDGGTKPLFACNQITNNRVDASGVPGAGYGGAISVVDAGSRLDLGQAVVSGNEVIDGAGVPRYGSALAVMAASEVARLDLDSVVFAGQGPTSEVVFLGSGSESVIGHASFGPHPWDQSALRTESGASLALHSSLSLASRMVDASAGGKVAGSCNFLRSGDDSFPSLWPLESISFEDAAGGDLRPRADAPVLDQCDDALFAPGTRDALNRTRPFDVPHIANGVGAFDAGAYEWYPDQVFEDGFEST